MKDRIREIRKRANLTQEKFAERLGLKRNTIATYETGKGEPMGNIIVSICREFGVNEEWLRYGTGEMYKAFPKKLDYYLGQISNGDDDFIKDLIEVYMELDQTSKKALRKIADAMIEKRKKREQK